MKDAFKAVKVTDRVYWVGAIDWSVRDFHGYLTSRGTTYNAYLILADRITLVDTVKAGFQNELLARIASVVDPSRVEVLISNHSEPDHSGSLHAVLDAIRPKEVYASVKGAEALQEHFRLGDRITTVKDGQKLNLGNMNVSCFETRMCHWPDSMVSYLHEEELLFSQDAFGMHLAGYERFDDQVDPVLLHAEAAKYYANILLPLSQFVTKSVEKLSSSGLKLRIVAPDHGPVWRKDFAWILDAYARWAQQKRVNKTLVVYDTMWNSTDLMARSIAQGAAAGGSQVRLMPLRGSHRSDVATEILDAGALVAGAPTLNSEMYPTMADLLTYLRGLKPKGLLGAAFGSYGWSGESTKDIKDVLEEMKVELVAEPLRAKYVPDDAMLKQCYDLGQLVAKRLSEKTGNP
jgi:flavorubredoxin